jgi:ribosomal protein L40E
MKAKYSDAEINQALDEIANDKEASENLWDDLCTVFAKHIRFWLERPERTTNRVNGIIIEKNGHSKMFCSKCKSLHPTTAIFCGHCGVQLQDTLLEKTKKKNLMGVE